MIIELLNKLLNVHIQQFQQVIPPFLLLDDQFPLQDSQIPFLIL